MARVIRLTEQELKGILSDLIKMSLGGYNQKDDSKTQDSEDDETETSTSDTEYNKYIINDHKLLLYDYYLGYDVNYNIYYENNIIKVMKNDFDLYISFKKNIDTLNYLILYELLFIFINIQRLNINDKYNEIDYEFIIELSKIFNFSIIVNR